MRYILTINNVNPEDQGTYEVVAINAGIILVQFIYNSINLISFHFFLHSAGEARCEAQVTIQDVASKTTTPTQEAKFVKPFAKESKAVEGGPTNLQVQVQSSGKKE